MVIPDLVVQLMGLSVIGVGGWSFRYLIGRIGEVEDKTSSCQRDINEKYDRREKDSRDRFDLLITKLTPQSHCDAKQELWNTRFDNIMEQSKKDHDRLELTIEHLAEQISELSDCVRKMALGDRC